MTTTNIYILRLQNGCWYVGKSSNPMKRFEEHLQGQGSAWTVLHKPIACEKVISNASAFDEDKYTKEYMAKYGIDKVRGGTYVETELEDEQVATLQKEIWGAQDKCTRCGRTRHFVKDCFASTNVNKQKINDTDDESEYSDVEYVYECEKCNREFDTEREVETHERMCKGNKKSMQTYYSKYQTPKKDTKPSNTCYRCGRAGHYASDCYATTFYSKRGWYDSDSD
jgi:predicted GIY-YIG superfamily endonuclease